MSSVSTLNVASQVSTAWVKALRLHSGANLCLSETVAGKTVFFELSHMLPCCNSVSQALPLLRNLGCISTHGQ